jgi:RNA polymerase sigma-70 factor, ECF subfamily
MDIYRRYGPALLRKAERMLQSRDEAQDLVQNLFVDLLPRAQGPAAPVDLPYLYRAITNRCLNHLRDRKNQGRLLSEHDQALRGLARTRLDDQVVDRQFLLLLIERIDEQTLEILVYAFVDDMTQDEIAALVGTSRKTVVRRLQRVRDLLRSMAPHKTGDQP